MAIYLRGLMMGLAYVAPIGTQNLFVINTAVTQCSGAQLMSKMAHNSCQSIFMHINRNSPEEFSGL